MNTAQLRRVSSLEAPCTVLPCGQILTWHSEPMVTERLPGPHSKCWLMWLVAVGSLLANAQKVVQNEAESFKLESA